MHPLAKIEGCLFTNCTIPLTWVSLYLVFLYKSFGFVATSYFFYHATKVSVIFTLTLTVIEATFIPVKVFVLCIIKIKMAHGFCQYGRNYVKDSQIARGDVEYYNWSLYSAASQVTGNKSVTLAMTKVQ